MYSLKKQSKRIFQVLVFTFLINPFSFGQTNQSDSLTIENKFESDYPNVLKRQFNKGNIHHLSAAVQGLAPGLWAPQSTADPNLQNNLRIRGLTGLGFSTFESVNPTVSLLGFKGLRPQDIDPFFIERLAVIKDGQLTKYGLQGGLGALELKPYEGKGKNQVTFHSFFSTEREIDNDPVLSAGEFRDLSLSDDGADTDWRDEIGQNGQAWVNQLSFSGSRKNVDYYLGVSQRNVSGIQQQTGFNQTNGFLNIGTSLFKNRLKVRAIGMHGITNRELGYASVYEYADRFNPTSPVRLANQEYNQPQIFGYFNPVTIINENTRETNESRSMGMILADVSLGDWFWKNQAGIYYEDVTGLFSSTGVSSFTNFFVGSNAASEREIRSFRSEALRDLSFGNLHFRASAGIESQLFTETETIDFQYTEGGDNFFTKHEVQLMAFFSGVNFSAGNLNGEFNFRREGSSALSTSQRWNNYFSSSLRYNFSNLESFSRFEVFGSFGTSGMTPFQSGMTKRLVRQSDFPNPPIINQNPTDQLSQMASTHLDIGINIAPKKGTWQTQVNFFTNRTRDFWFRQFDDASLDFNTWVNTAELRTAGLEIVSDASLKLGEVNWNIRGVFSSQRTKIEDAGFINNSRFSAPGFGCGSGTIHRIQSGDDFGNIYGPRFVSFNSTMAQGLSWELEDVNDDGFIDGQDDQVIGNAMPDWTLGIQHQMDWKRFTLALNFRGAFGHDVVNFRALHTTPINVGFNVRNSRIDSDLRFVEQYNQWNSYFVENGSFLRLQVITIQYQVPVKVSWIQDLNFYFTGNNLMTITGYDGNPELQLTNNSDLDGTPGVTPQVMQWTPGIDRHDAWPHSKSFTFGLNAKL